MALPKNIRNYKAYLEKKKRGPVKTFFHITKNENVPAIEKKGLLANHPNANINSAFQPFRKHGSTGGGVWVTTEPTAFPVYGTTIGGRSGDASARADALTTFKIDIPKAELPKMLAVQDPYGKNILRKGNDPKAIEPFSTWYGIDVPTTVFLNDMKPAWLKNLGYLEERAPTHQMLNLSPEINELRGGWDLSPGADYAELLRPLSKGDLRDYSGMTGHGHGSGTYNKSPQRFVEDYLDNNRPIMYRLPLFPVVPHPNRLGRLQGAMSGPSNNSKRYSVGFIPAVDWTNEYRRYIKPGESIQDRRSYEFAPGAISRGMGAGLPPIKTRNFDWNRYNKLLSEGDNPHIAAFAAQPSKKLDWDNIKHHNVRGYGPQTISAHDFDALSEGAITRGMLAEAPIQHRLDNATDIIDANNDDLLKLVKISNYGTEHLPGQIDNPKMQAMLNTYIDRLPMPYLSNMLNNQPPISPLSKGPFRNYINDRYTVRNQQIADLRDAEDKLAIRMSKHKRLHESDLRRLFELVDQHRRLADPRAGDFPPGFINMNSVYKVLYQFGSLDKLSEQDQAMAKRILHDLEKQYNQQSK